MRNIILWSYTHDDFSNYFQALQLRIHGKTAECMSNDFQGEVVLYITPPLGGGYVHAVSGNIPKLSGCGYMGIHLKYIGILPGEVLIYITPPR